MPSVRLRGSPSPPSSSHVRARVSSTRSAIMSIAVSRSRSSHSVAPGRRWRTVLRRPGLVTRLLDAEPFGHSRPREMGLSGSPSIWTTLSSLTYTFCPQPTAQKGQIDLTMRSAVAVRGVSFSERFDCAARPSPSGSSRSWRNSGTRIRCRSGQALGLVLPEEALEQAPVALLVVEDRDDHVLGHEILAVAELDDPVVVLDRAGLGLDHALDHVHDVGLVLGRLEVALLGAEVEAAGHDSAELLD